MQYLCNLNGVIENFIVSCIFVVFAIFFIYVCLIELASKVDVSIKEIKTKRFDTYLITINELKDYLEEDYKVLRDAVMDKYERKHDDETFENLYIQIEETMSKYPDLMGCVHDLLRAKNYYQEKINNEIKWYNSVVENYNKYIQWKIVRIVLEKLWRVKPDNMTNK